MFLIFTFLNIMSDWRTPKKQVCNRCGDDHAEQLKKIWNCTWNETAEKVDRFTEREEKTSLLSKFVEALLKLSETPKYVNDFKIKEEFQINTVLLEKLKRYQISTDSNDMIYKNNSVIHALKQTNSFDEETLEKMKLICSDPHPYINDLNKLGNEFDICFRVVGYEENTNSWDDITHRKRCIGNPNGKLIELALIEGHFILNEIVEGISSFALKNYKEINEILEGKDDAYKLKVVKQLNGRYKTDTKQAHIKSYELIRLITQNKVEN